MSTESTRNVITCPHSGKECTCLYGPVPAEIDVTIDGERRKMLSQTCGRVLVRKNVHSNLLRRISRAMEGLDY